MQVTFEYGNAYDAKLTNTLDTKYSQLYSTYHSALILQFCSSNDIM